MNRVRFPWATLAWVIGIAVVLVIVVGVIWLGVQAHSNDCKRREQAALAIIQHDPAAAKEALDLYSENCP